MNHYQKHEGWYMKETEYHLYLYTKPSNFLVRTFHKRVITDSLRRFAPGKPPSRKQPYFEVAYTFGPQKSRIHVALFYKSRNWEIHYQSGFALYKHHFADHQSPGDYFWRNYTIIYDRVGALKATLWKAFLRDIYD